MTFFFDALPAAVTAAEAAEAAASVAAVETSGAIAAESMGAISAGTATGAGAGFAPAGASFLSTAATYLPTAAQMAGASGVVSAGGAIMSGQQQGAAMRYNARISENNALNAQRVGAAQANQMYDQNRKALATATAAAAANGGQISSGSPLDALAEFAGQAKLQEETARWQAGATSANYGQQARMDRSQVGQATSAGYLQGGATLLNTEMNYRKIGTAGRFGSASGLA